MFEKKQAALVEHCQLYYNFKLDYDEDDDPLLKKPTSVNEDKTEHAKYPFFSVDDLDESPSISKANATLPQTPAAKTSKFFFRSRQPLAQYTTNNVATPPSN